MVADKKVSQKSKGDNSPNTHIDNVEGDFVQQVLARPRSTSNEVEQMLRVISELSEKSSSFSVTADEDTTYRKLLKEKLAKFPKWADKLNYDYANLAVIYAVPYRDAWQSSDIDEYNRIKLAKYLSSRSIALLEAHADNALLAIDALCSEIEGAMPADDTFDANAIRFFIYMQFIECNVFPLIEADDE